MGPEGKRKLVIAAALFLFVVVVVIIFAVINLTRSDEPITDSEVIAPQQTDITTPGQFQYAGFNNLERIGMTIVQREFVELHAAEFVRTHDKSNEGIIALTFTTLESINQGGTNTITVTLTTPQKKAYSLTINFQEAGHADVVIRDANGSVVYTSPDEHEHTDPL